MAISKVTLNGTTLMDATTATAAAADITSPKTAMLANGVVTPGTGTAPTGTKQISITANGTTTEDVTNYASAEITVNVSGGGGNSDDAWMNRTITAITTTQTDFKLSLDGFNLLEEFNAPYLTNLYNANYFFRNCYVLERLNLKALERIYGASIFQNCRALQYLVLPMLGTGVNGSNQSTLFGIDGCTNLKALDCKVFNSIAASAFNNDTNFDTIIIREMHMYNRLPSLANVNAFDGTPFASGGAGGTIYLCDDYYNHLGDGAALDFKAATNWSTLDGYGTITWARLTGSQYENYYADGTAIPST